VGGERGDISNKNEPVGFRKELETTQKAGVDDCLSRRWG